MERFRGLIGSLVASLGVALFSCAAFGQASGTRVSGTFATTLPDGGAFRVSAADFERIFTQAL